MKFESAANKLQSAKPSHFPDAARVIARRRLVRTDSPSMDILVSSNLERYLYEASGGDT